MKTIEEIFIRDIFPEIKEPQIMKTIENIYPMTIVARRYGGYAIIEAESDIECVSDFQGYENWHYDYETPMESDWSGIRYGVGDSIESAFEDFKRRNNESNING